METELVNEIIAVAQTGTLENKECRDELRAKIALLEDAMKKYPEVDVPLTHTFSKGVYAREIAIKKGSLIVGKIHNFANMNIISKGKVSFFSIDGAVHAEAPYTFVASPGTKRVIYAHEDSVWTTIHGTDETDLEKIEKIFIAKNYEQLIEIDSQKIKLLGGV